MNKEEQETIPAPTAEELFGDLLVDTTQDWTSLHPGTYWVAVGFEKSGKTTAFSTFSEKGADGVLHLDLEGGVRTSSRNSIQISSLNPMLQVNASGGYELVDPIKRGRRVNGEPVPSISMSELFDKLEAVWDKSGKQVLVLDTVDKLSDWCNESALQEIKQEDALSKTPKFQNVTAPEEIPYAQCYTRGRVKVIGVVNTLLDIIGNNGVLVLISHLKKTTTITEGRDVIVKRVPKLPEGLAAALGYGAEAIVHIEVDEAGKHFADFRGYNEVLMGTRIGPLHGKRFIWSMNSPNTLYEVLMKECRKKK